MPASARPEPGPLTRGIAAAVRDRYADAGYTQEQLGDVIGVSQQQASRILNGERPADADQLWALCEAVGLDFLAVVRDVLERAKTPRRPKGAAGRIL